MKNEPTKKPINLQQKYRPNLSNLMNLSEMNYMLALRLLADKEQVGEVRHFFINDSLSYTLEVHEVTRYTSLISFIQNTPPVSQAFSTIMQPVMQLRLYHDARMVEVLSSQYMSNIKPRYDYPNENMRQPDEKQQVLLFLKEWLKLCLEQGQSAVEIPLNNE